MVNDSLVMVIPETFKPWIWVQLLSSHLIKCDDLLALDGKYFQWKFDMKNNCI